VNGLDLFSGIGGISEALAPWVRPIAYCENDESNQAMLLSRMARGELFQAPIWDDVRTLHGGVIGESEVDIVYGGFPCQDISLAGDGRGLDGDRSGLFFEIVRIVNDVRPSFVFLENVPAITTRGLDRITAEFSKLRYNCRWSIVSAKEVGAHHERKRWFCLASNTSSEPVRIPEPGQWASTVYASTTLEDGKNSDSDGEGMEIGWPRVGYEPKEPFGVELLEGDDWDQYAAFFLRMDHGLPHRGHRIRALGNSVVPVQTKTAFKRLCGLK
jgi:DNA (cytosine-5)-methyltransferase 1